MEEEEDAFVWEPQVARTAPLVHGHGSPHVRGEGVMPLPAQQHKSEREEHLLGEELEAR
ncbi:hypothetical protein E2C01_097015 [Portunus trituberculatus]|uniref:Uncharacterized protein n=1 Tax=Portunus trituberculatus TaxID=210409 RepID=A0A5B7JZB7_PORTR|nr:hypothetical protein [Portunus trituberculatus]